jgi:uncharacterized membrane protein
MDRYARQESNFPVAAGMLFGLGLGGFFDGILLHQVLQWHHMLTSAGYPPDSVHNLEVNTLWDGFFHLSTYIFVVLGLLILGYVRDTCKKVSQGCGTRLGADLLDDLTHYGPADAAR